MTYKAIIFDMDGVLVDTESFYLQRREQFFANENVDISAFTPSDFIGGNMKEMWTKILGSDFDSREIQNRYENFKRENPLPYERLLFDDVKNVLSDLINAGFKLALASSSSMEDIEKMLNIHDLGRFFPVKLSGNDFVETKPNPEIYLTALKKLAVKSDEALIIEDSEKGIQAGKAANITVWAIKDDRFGMNQSLADAHFPNLTAVKNQLFKLSNPREI